MSSLMEYLLTRRTTPSANLGLPAPDEDQLQAMLTAAARVPDHKKLEPWRFIRFSEAGCEAMGQLLAERAKSLDPDIHPRQLEMERQRFKRAPMVVAVVSSLKDTSRAPAWEQYLSAGAVCMNLIHAAHASGFSAQWLSEWFAYDAVILEKLGLEEGEEIAGFIHIGTPNVPTTERPRPDLEAITTVWDG